MLGDFVGLLVGDFVGLLVGDFIGLLVGDFVGLFADLDDDIGLAVAVVVRRPPAGRVVVGELVGFNKGLAVGVAVGVSVGVAVGLAVLPMERSLSTGLLPLNAQTKDTCT